VDAVWLLPGTPYRDDDAARAAIHHCLDTGTPFPPMARPADAATAEPVAGAGLRPRRGASEGRPDGGSGARR
jgi:hypothetical protein